MHNKETTIQRVAEELNVSRALVAPIFEAILASIVQSLAVDGQGLQLNNFGTLAPFKRRAMQARNPKTKALVQVPEKLTVKFKPSPALLAAMATKEHPYLVKNGIALSATLASLSSES